MMNVINMVDINQQFINDLASDYIMECFKYSYIDTAGASSAITDIDTDSPRKGLIVFSNNVRDSINMTEMTFYYRNSSGDIDVAFSIKGLSNLFEFNQQLSNRLFIDLYELTDTIKCKFKYFNSQSYAIRQMHKSNFVPFALDNLSTKFSDMLSFTHTAYLAQENNVSLELRKQTSIKPTNLILSYDNKFFQNNTGESVTPQSIFEKDNLELIPKIDYERTHQYNNEEYIIMSTFNIPILGQNILELDYEDSRETYILLSTGLEGGLNPQREMKAIKVDQFVNAFKNVITIWDNTQNYVEGDTVKSPLTNNLYKCIANHSGQNPVYRDLSGAQVNRDAGKYWIMYDNVPIGSEITLHVNNDGRDALVNKYADSYIFVGGPDQDSSFPETWTYTNNLMSSSLDLVTLNINGVDEQRYRSKFHSDKGRYNRLIPSGVGLDQRDHAIADNIKLALPRFNGTIGLFMAPTVNLGVSTTGVFYPQFNFGSFGGVRSGGSDNSHRVVYDSYRQSGGDRTQGIKEGNSAEVTRGDEIDKFYLVKVR